MENLNLETAGQMSTSTIVVSIIFSVIMIVAIWRIFVKANEAGWKSLIPILNGYTLFKISWKGSLYWISLVIGFVGCILYTSGLAYSSETTGVVLLILAVVVFIAGIIFSVIYNHKLSKAFGHGVGFTVGLILLNPIFMLILAFGKSQYIGKDN